MEQESNEIEQSPEQETDLEQVQPEPVDEETSEQQEEETETVITIEDKPLESNDSNVLRTLRTKFKEKDKRVKELEKRLSQIEKPDVGIEQPKRPRIADFNYDDDQYEKAMDDYIERNRAFVEHQNRQLQEQRTVEESFKAKQDQYNNKKTDLKLNDYDDVEDLVKATLNPTQQGIIIDSADNPALLVYALGKSPEKLRELSEIKNPIHYVKALVKMEAQIKTQQTRRPKTSPEKIVAGGSAGVSEGKIKELEKLRDKGRKTGDFTAAVQYRKKHNL